MRAAADGRDDVPDDVTDGRADDVADVVDGWADGRTVAGWCGGVEADGTVGG